MLTCWDERVKVFVWTMEAAFSLVTELNAYVHLDSSETDARMTVLSYTFFLHINVKLGKYIIEFGYVASFLIYSLSLCIKYMAFCFFMLCYIGKDVFIALCSFFFLPIFWLLLQLFIILVLTFLFSLLYKSGKCICSNHRNQVIKFEISLNNSLFSIVIKRFIVLPNEYRKSSGIWQFKLEKISRVLRHQGFQKYEFGSKGM